MYDVMEIDAERIIGGARLRYSGMQVGALTKALEASDDDAALDAAQVIKLFAEKISEVTASRDACCQAASRDRSEIGRLAERVQRLEDGLMGVVGLADRNKAGNNACKLIADMARGVMR